MPFLTCRRIYDTLPGIEYPNFGQMLKILQNVHSEFGGTCGILRPNSEKIAVKSKADTCPPYSKKPNI